MKQHVKYRMPVYFVIMLCVLLASGAARCRQAKQERFVERIPDGPEVIFEPHSGSGVVCAAVAVKAGSAFESPTTRGMSHFLEHMVFNGSERYSRNEISRWIDDHGGFLNAFTRKETTVYFLLVDSSLLEQGLEILSQMLLHSVFPPEELEKERKVVLEELGKTMDNPIESRSRLIDRYLYRGSALTEPVLGGTATIETIPRSEIIRYYREKYSPAEMRIFLIGGFDMREARGWIGDYFSVPGAPAPQRPAEPRVPRWSNEITVRNSKDLKPGLDILVPAPKVGDRDFPAAMILAEMLGGSGSPLKAKFESFSLPEPEVSLETHQDFSAFHVHAGSAEPEEDGYGRVPGLLESLADWEPSAEEIESARVSILASEVFDREKYHFYIMASGERIALFGNTYLENCLSGVERVTVKDCRRLLRDVFSPLRYNACLVQRDAHTGAGTGPRGIPVYRLLPNGCTIAAEERPGSGVAAIHILIRGRNCIESASGGGLPVVLHSVLQSSAGGTALEKKLDAMGARLQWGDNPYIPFDDYYLDPSFSFIRLEAPAAAIRDAGTLLIELLSSYEIGPDDVKAAMGRLRMELGVRSASPRAELKVLLYGGLFADHPYGTGLFPGMGALARITAEDIATFRSGYFTGGNIIATVVSPLEAGDALDMLAGLCAGFGAGKGTECPDPVAGARSGVLDRPSRKEGAYLSAGWVITGADRHAAAAALVAGEVLSRRMQDEIRERQGLAYSTGCGVSLFPGGAVVNATVGTRGTNLEKAMAALEFEIARLTSEPPSTQEIQTAVSRLIGRNGRRELSSINRAYAIGLDLHLFGVGEREGDLSYSIGAVLPEDVSRIVQKYYSPDEAFFVRLLPGGGSGP